MLAPQYAVCCPQQQRLEMHRFVLLQAFRHISAAKDLFQLCLNRKLCELRVALVRGVLIRASTLVQGLSSQRSRNR